MQRSAPRAKEVTHERIVEAAARAIRRSGYDGTSVADIMKEAGLTHGGFYAHFASREAMLAEAADRAGAEAVAAAARVAATAPPEQALQRLLHAYLSKEHVKSMEMGCPVAALGSEMPRQTPEVRRAATRRIKEMIDVVARQSPDWGHPGAHEHALVTVITMVGALLLARAVDDPKLSDALLKAALQQLAAAGTLVHLHTCRLFFERKYDASHMLTMGDERPHPDPVAPAPSSPQPNSRRPLKGIPMKLNKSIALVTGASSGIGKATAERLATAGYKVYGTSRRGGQTGQRSFGMLPLDVTSDDSVAAAVNELMRLEGRVDLLVNNAGFGVAPAGAEESSVQQARSIFETNFFGIVRMTRAVVPYMRKQGGGRIINIGSVLGFLRMP